MSHEHCCNHGHGHHHHHHNECCSHEHEHECCHEDVCSHHHETCSDHDHEHFYEELLQMADEAWMEVLKCKIKDQIKEQNGEQLDKLAQLVSSGNHGRWKNKMASKRGINDFKSKVREFFREGA